MSDRIRVIVADDHPLYRSGVVSTLREYPGIDVAGEGGSAADAIRLAGDLKPDVALLDISMPGGGLAAAAEIARASLPTRVIILTASEVDEDVIAALEAGAAGYTLKGVGGDDLAAIIRTVAAGGSYVAPTLAGRLLLNARTAGRESSASLALSTLSARELDVARLLTGGKSNKEIAIVLGLQEKTIKHHMTQVLQKLRARNRVEAAMMMRDYLERKPARAT